MATREQTYDDLTRVKGIGEKRQAWLQEEMHVYRYPDLAALSVGELETQLRKAGQPVSRNAVKEWIDQAKLLLAQAQTDEKKAANSVLEKDAPHPSLKEIHHWRPFASFVVEYQERLQEGQKQRRTTVHHVEADGGETWPGVVQKALCQWMQERAGVRPAETEVVQDVAVSEEITLAYLN